MLSAFQKVTATYKTLEHFCWDETGAKLIERLKTQVHRKREDGMTLSQRVRRTTIVYQQFFKAATVWRGFSRGIALERYGVSPLR